MWYGVTDGKGGVEKTTGTHFMAKYQPPPMWGLGSIVIGVMISKEQAKFLIGMNRHEAKELIKILKASIKVARKQDDK